MAHIKANGTEYDIPEGSTAEEAFEGLKAVDASLSNATLKKDGENWIAETNFGKKG